MTEPTIWKHCHQVPFTGQLGSPSDMTSRRRSMVASRMAGGFLPLAVALLAWAAVATANSPTTLDASPTLTLSNEHLGMSAEEIEASQAGAVVEPAPIEAAAPSAPQTEVESLAAIAKEARQRADEAAERAEAARLAVEEAERAEAARAASEAGEAGSANAVAGSQQSATDHASCIEAAIRRGAGYAESDRVCRAAFGGSAE